LAANINQKTRHHRRATPPATAAGLVGLCVLITFFAARSGYREYQALAYTQTALGAPLHILDVTWRKNNLPASPASQTRMLKLCVQGPLSLQVGLFPAHKAAQFANHCLNLAMVVLQTSPTLSAAHTSAAIAYFALAKFDHAEAALAAARKTAPAEGWLAQRRASFQFMNFARQNAPALTGLGQDVSVLLENASSRAWVAAWYANRPDLRGFLTSTIAQAPPQTQQAFLWQLNALVRMK